jgi:hypothetical protein
MNTRILLASTLATSFLAIASFAESCPPKAMCETLAKQTAACQKWYSEAKCDTFVVTYQKLAPRYDCKNPKDGTAVPAILMCNIDSTDNPLPSEKSAELLAKLKFAKAKEFFSSQLFRSTLTGESANHWTKRSMNAEKEKNEKK